MVPAIGRLPISGACAWLAGFKVRRLVRSRSSGVLVSPNSSGPRNDGGVVSNRYSNAACRADPWVTRQQIGRSIGRCQGDRRTAARADGKLFEATLVNAVAAGVLKRKLTTIIDWSPVHGAGAVADTCELIRGLLRKWSEPAARRWPPTAGRRRIRSVGPTGHRLAGPGVRVLRQPRGMRFGRARRPYGGRLASTTAQSAGTTSRNTDESDPPSTPDSPSTTSPPAGRIPARRSSRQAPPSGRARRAARDSPGTPYPRS